MAEPLFVRWLRTESRRERREWLPWHPAPSGSANAGADDVGDPDRLVLYDDMSDMLLPMAPAQHGALFRMLLSLFGLPLEPQRPARRSSNELAARDPATWPAIRAAHAWSSLLQRPTLVPPCIPLEADLVFPQPGAYPAVDTLPGALVSGTDAGMHPIVLVWATAATPADRVNGQLAEDQVAFVR